MSDVLDLNDVEAMALARRLAANQVANHENWLFWEDLPELGEYAFERLADAMDSLADEMRRGVRLNDAGLNIDSFYLWEQTQ